MESNQIESSESIQKDTIKISCICLESREGVYLQVFQGEGVEEWR